MSLVQMVPIRFLLAIVLLHLNNCTCFDMEMGQVIRFELFNFDNSSISAYFTKLTIGSPPKTFNMLIDTGSDLTWVDCTNTHPNSFNTSESTSVISCPKGKKCNYHMTYKDGSESSGFVLLDVFYFDTYLPDSSPSQFSTPIVFGCSTLRKGTLVNSKIDGILGLGRDRDSLVSQLFSKQIAPNIISHCLAYGGGGYLLLGEAVEPGTTYSPLIPSESKYIASLRNISVNGRQISCAGNEVAIFDSGTTYTLLAAEIYDSVVATVSEVVNKSIIPGISGVCYDVPSRDIFPQITLNFNGGAAMIFMPKDYIQYYGVWCIDFQRDEKLTIVGDLLLRDKVIIYDQPQKRIGWVTRNCSLPVNVSMEYNIGSNSVVSLKFRGTQHWGLWRLASIGVTMCFSLML